jgi:hypothetical protein
MDGRISASAIRGRVGAGVGRGSWALFGGDRRSWRHAAKEESIRDSRAKSIVFQDLIEQMMAMAI